MKYFSMFSGIGGFDKPLNELRYECIGYCEIDKYADWVYRYNFGKEIKNYGNAKELKPDDLQDFDLLVGGFPCQAFSIAGKRKGFEDTRGTLFFDIARVLKVKKPKVVLLENVKGLLNHKAGKTFKVILETLDELGYQVEWMVLNSKFFGVPQNRERVFIIGCFRGGCRGKVLPLRENAKEISGISEEETINCGTITQAFGRYGCSKEELRMYEATYKAHRANEMREHKGSPTLTQNMGTGGHNVPLVMNTQKRDINRPSIKKRIDAGLKPNAGSGTIGKEDEAYCLDAGNNQGVARALDANMHKGVTPKYHYEKRKRNIVAVRSYPRTGKKEQDGDRIQNIEMQREDASNSLTNIQKDNLLGDYDRLRRLTPIECERLQGFPDDWTAKGLNDKDEVVDISDTQRYRQLGNAVTVNVVRAIVERL